MPAENTGQGLNPKSAEAPPVEVIPSRELKILYAWKALSRPFKKRDREFWTTVVAIVFLVGLILFFVKEWFLIAAIVSLTFVYYVLSTVPPEEVEYKITNKGLIFAGQAYFWEDIAQYWFSEKYQQRMVNLELRAGLVGRLTLMLGPAEEKTVRLILSKYLLEEEAPPSFLDKTATWLQKKVPLEEEKKNPPPSVKTR